MYTGEGGYTLNELVLRRGEDNIDLRAIFIDLTLYESIWEHFMSGSISIVDNFSLKEIFPLTGEEEISIKFNTNGIEEFPIEFVGYVFSISESNTVSDHSVGYVLKFCSKAMLNVSRAMVNRGYKNTASEIVKSVFNLHFKGSQKPLETVSSKGLLPLTFGNINASEAVSIALRNAISTAGDTGYLFWEDNLNFNCKPLQFLYKQPATLEYYYKGHNAFTHVELRDVEAFNAIQDCEDVSDFSYFESLKQGSLGSKNVYFDIFTKSQEVITYDIQSEFNSSKSLGKYPLKVKDIVNKKYEDIVALEITSGPTYSNGVKSFYKKVEANQIRKRILVFGDSSVRVGRTCNAWLPKLTSFGEDDVDFVSGKFLIAEIKHSLTNTQYHQTMMLCKDAYEKII